MENTQIQIKKILFEKLLALDHEIVNIWYRVGFTQLNMRMYRCKCTAEVKSVEYSEDDPLSEGEEPDTYTEYTITGETDEPDYLQHFSFVDDMIVGAKLTIRSESTDKGYTPMLVFHIDMLAIDDDSTQRHKVMFVFPATRKMLLALSDIMDTDSKDYLADLLETLDNEDEDE